MKTVWTYRDIDAPADEVWQLLIDPEHWPAWGPSVRSATIDDGHMTIGATGSVVTALGGRLRFKITRFEEGSRWAWQVAGVDATDHTVEALTNSRCRVGFGVPWVVAPYQLICQIALQRIKAMAERTEVQE